MKSLINGESERYEKIYKLIEKWHIKVSILSFIIGLIWFFILPHKLHVHRTYMSENALSPGLVTSDIQNSEELTRYYEATKKFFEKETIDVDWIRKQFERIGIEVYTQNFNISNPFYETTDFKIAETVNAKNIYAIARAHRTPSQESIIISAPLTYVENNEHVKNTVGISQLFALAKLAKTTSYWAKDLIFVVSDVGYFGIQAWLNSYFDIDSIYIQSDNLKARGGAIQAAINIEIGDPTVDRLKLKIEGPNGQLPNLDLFNTIIRICRNYDFKCGLDNINAGRDDFENYKNSFENTIKMMFRQSTGVPSSLHGFFLRHHIEALTVRGLATRKTSKHNSLRLIRIIEGTLRSVNNLLERFHQSFFFYILPNEVSYVSIGMYMPPLGLILLPALIHLLYTWQLLFKMKIQNRNKPYKIDLLKFVLPDMLLALLCGTINFIGTGYFINSGVSMNINPKDAIVSSHVTITINSIIVIFLMRRKIKFDSVEQKQEDQVYMQQIRELSWKIKKFMALISLTVFVGALSLLNFSLSFFIALFYIPLVLCLNQYKNIVFKIMQSLVVLSMCPLVFFTLLYLAYYSFNLTSSFSLFEFYEDLTQNFYDFVLICRVSSIWTYDLICLTLYPIWLFAWFICV